MSSEILNGHRFNLETKSFQDQAIAFAIQKAEQLKFSSNTKTHSKHYIRRTRKLSEFNDRKRVNIELNMDPFAIVELRGFGVV